MSKRTLQVAAAAIMAGLVAIGFSSPGRAAVSRVISMITGSRLESAFPEGAALTLVAQPDEDLERRARRHHGWTGAILYSVLQGAITFYDQEGAITGEGSLTVYRGYPNRLRVEIGSGGVVETLGFDGVNAWRSGSSNLDESRARDIRTWLRGWPERLFTTRAAGASYRESGPRTEMSKPGRPWQGPMSIVPPAEYEQVVMDDVIGPAPAPGRIGDRRRVVYYLNRDTDMVETARWLEPDDPRRAITDPDAQQKDVRVDFGDWQRVEGVLWPFEVVHWSGGRVDYRIALSQVQMNQPLGDAIFQRP